MRIYKSPYPSLPLTEHSLFAHLFPEKDPFNPDAPAFIDGVSHRVVTRRQLRDESLALGWGLRNALRDFTRRNLVRGDRVMLFSPNDIAYPLVIFGAVTAGVTLTFASSSYTPTELAHQLRDSTPKYVFVHPKLLPVLLSAFALLKLSPTDSKLRTILMSSPSDQPQYLTLPALLSHSLARRDPSFTAEDFSGPAAHTTVYIYYSSGTTGLPKGVELTHYNINACMDSSVPWSILDPKKDVSIGVLPLYHVYGNAMLITFPLLTGIPVVLNPGFEPNLFLSSIRRYKVTFSVTVPPIILFLANSPLVDKYDISSLKYLIVAAAPVSPDLVSRAKTRLDGRGCNVAIAEGYGLTETSPSIAISPLVNPRPGTIGHLLSNIEARLVDDDGKDVAEGARGELWVRGPNIMKGYLNNPDATQASITPDRWFKTGDVAVGHPDGTFSIVDRKKELIKYKGFQVPPAELEGVLISHPGIADAGVTAFYLRAEETEVPRGYVVPRDASLLKNKKQADEFVKSLQLWMREHTAPYKQCRGGIILVDSIPRSQAGKILRRNLRTMAKEAETHAKL